MFLRAVLIASAISQALLAADFGSPTLFPNQNTGSLRDLTRKALDRQIRSSYLGRDKDAKDQPSLPMFGKPALPMLNQRVQIASNSTCSIPLTNMKADRAKHFAVRSLPMPQRDLDSIAKVPPIPTCKE